MSPSRTHSYNLQGAEPWRRVSPGTRSSRMHVAWRVCGGHSAPEPSLPAPTSTVHDEIEAVHLGEQVVNVEVTLKGGRPGGTHVQQLRQVRHTAGQRHGWQAAAETRARGPVGCKHPACRPHQSPCTLDTKKTCGLAVCELAAEADLRQQHMPTHALTSWRRTRLQRWPARWGRWARSW